MKRFSVVLSFTCLFVFSALSGAYADCYGCRAAQGKCAMGGGIMGQGPMGGGMMGEWRHGMRGGMMEGVHPHIGQYLRQLNLSPDQKAEIRDIQRKMLKNMIRTKADIRIAKLDLSNLLSADEVDLKAVEAKAKQIADLKTGLLLSAVKAHEDIKSKLTPDQRKKLRELMNQPMMSEAVGQSGDAEGDMEDFEDEYSEEAPQSGQQ